MPTQREPMRPGTIISYCDTKAFVLADTGGRHITVLCRGQRQEWEWSLDDSNCKIFHKPAGRLFYDSFDAYVTDFPRGEAFRNWLTKNGSQEVSFIRLTDFGDVAAKHPHLPGWYLSLQLHEIDKNTIQLYVTDNDDGFVYRRFHSSDREKAVEMIQNIKEATPLTMTDLIDVFGFSC